MRATNAEFFLRHYTFMVGKKRYDLAVELPSLQAGLSPRQCSTNSHWSRWGQPCDGSHMFRCAPEVAAASRDSRQETQEQGVMSFCAGLSSNHSPLLPYHTLGQLWRNHGLQEKCVIYRWVPFAFATSDP